MNQGSAPSLVALTGGTSGLGLATVRRLLGGGAEVIAIGRDAHRSAQVEAQLRSSCPGARVDYIVGDLSTTTEVRRVADAIRCRVEARGPAGLDALVNNAAVVSGSHRGARIRWEDPMSSRGYHTLRVYRQSKLANVLFSAEFNRRYAGRSHVRAYVFDPGLVRTDIGTKSSSGIEALVWRLRSRSRRAAPPEIPAEHLAELALAPDLVDPSAIYRYLDRPVAPDPAGLDPGSGTRLWALSERLCGVRLQAAS